MCGNGKKWAYIYLTACFKFYSCINVFDLDLLPLLYMMLKICSEEYDKLTCFFLGIQVELSAIALDLTMVHEFPIVL